MACGGMQHVRLTANDLEAAVNDPTLADCCRRDLEQQAKTSRLVDELRGYDRTTERSKLAQRVLAAEAAPADAPATACCEGHGTDACCQSAELGRLRHERMQEMRAEAARRREAAALQYGVLHETPMEDALALLQLAHLCVCHMAGGGRDADQAVDHALQSLARLHQHALFLRAPFDPDSLLARHCRLPGPGLVCLRDGTPIAAGPHQAFVAGGRLPDSGAISTWLHQAGLLTSKHTNAPLGAPSTALDLQDSETDDWQEPCVICGRSYVHQHVPPATQQAQWSDEET